VRLYKEFKKDNCLLRASGLSYTSLLALVPLTALIFSLFNAFDAFEGIKDSLQKYIVTILIPTRQDEILVFIDQFLKNSKTMGIIGLLLFTVTSIMLLDRISESFNSIWGSKNNRNFIAKFTSYTSVIVFGTIFIGASFTLTAPIRRFLENLPNIQFIIRWLVVLSPSIFIFLTFFLMITAIPAGRVKFKSSFIGALAGTILWDIARRAFTEGAGYVIRMSKLYGSLAVIPIFLFWLYLIWIIIFLALEITYVHQNNFKLQTDIKNKTLSPKEYIETGLIVFYKIAASFDSGGKYYSTASISFELKISESIIGEIVESFTRTGLLYEQDQHDSKLLPARSLNKIFVKDVLLAIIGKDSIYNIDNEGIKLLNTLIAGAYKSIEALTVEDFLKQT
ncbi:MAG: YihY family inner membrane protein, partial [Spirochaetaceae bacterium]|nr:YihY family inner membrane protein [Spirochaetaceae bacterium]